MVTITKPLNRETVVNVHKAVLVDTVGGVKFYEYPTRGDESPPLWTPVTDSD